MSSPLVSILTPVYNREEFIGPCIEASLAQTYTNFELIVSDNASTDGTWDICQDYAKRDSRIRLFRNATNLGAIPNWRRTFDEARGWFGKIVFSDDMIHPAFLARTLPLMDEDVAFVVSPAEIGSAPGQGKIFYQWKRDDGVYPAEEYFHATLRARMAVSPVSMLNRVDDLRKYLRTDIQSPSIKDFARHAAGPDLLMELLIASAYPKFAFVAEPLAFFRSHSGTLTASVKGLNDCYAQARICFGLESGMQWFTSMALGATWLRKMRERRAWVRPSDLKQQFLCDPESIETLDLIGGACKVLSARALAYRLMPRAIPINPMVAHTTTNQSPHRV